MARSTKPSPMAASPRFMAPPTTPPPSKPAPQQNRPRASKVSFGAPMTQQVKHGILVPRVGGVIKLDKGGEAFTGGSNLQVSSPLPEHSLQRCPLKISDQQMFHTACKTGVQNKLAAVDACHSDTSIVDWFTDLASLMKELGLDTIFWIPNSTWTEEACISEKWGDIQTLKVTAWLEESKKSQQDPSVPLQQTEPAQVRRNHLALHDQESQDRGTDRCGPNA